MNQLFNPNAGYPSNDFRWLEDYSGSRASGDELTIRDLVLSHRQLVEELNQGQRAEWRKEQQAAIRRGEQAARDAAMEDSWIHVSTLVDMSVGDLAGFLHQRLECEEPVDLVSVPIPWVLLKKFALGKASRPMHLNERNWCCQQLGYPLGYGMDAKNYTKLLDLRDQDLAKQVIASATTG